MPRTRRSPRALAVAVAGLAAALGVCHAAAHPVTAHAAETRHVAMPSRSASAQPVQARPVQSRPVQSTPVQATTLAANDPGGGLCSVPGIGDIGGLLGFCSLG